MPNKTLALVNATGRQAASVARVAAAVGYNVRAHVMDKTYNVAQELQEMENINVVEGSLEDKRFLSKLFTGAHQAYINTLSWGDEVAIGKALADAAKRAGIQHVIYSSMPDHSVFGKGWPALPHWSVKFVVENYIRQIELPATFLYTGIYNNNFTSQPIPLFCMKLQPDGSFVWKAPFHPHTPQPWLDAEHDVGPAVLQIFKDGLRKWSGHRYSSPVISSFLFTASTNHNPKQYSIALAFEVLTPTQVCAIFSRALNRPVSYIYSPTIDIEVSIPDHYLEQLQALEVIFGKYDAPYFGLDLEKGAPKDRTVSGDKDDEGNALDDGAGTVAQEARALWGGWRGIEEYAREVFPVEEANNGLTWMKEEEGTNGVEK